MRRNVLALTVLFAAGALQACLEEEDLLAPMLDASQPGAMPGGNDGAVSFADAALGAAEAGSVLPLDSGVDAAQSADASSMSAPDAATEASLPSDAGGGTPGAAAQGYSPCPGGGMPCKILPLGDSITYGLGYSGGYRVALFNKANADSKPITFVGTVMSGPTMAGGKTFPRNNEGYSGYTITQIAGKVPTPALNTPPHIVLLMAGTNDISFNSDLANAPKRLGALIDELTTADAKTLVVVAQVTPTSSGGGATSPLGKFNAALPAVVAARVMEGKHVLLVDMNTGFPGDGLDDPVHPNQKGYEWMAGVWYKAIGPLLR